MRLIFALWLSAAYAQDLAPHPRILLDAAAVDNLRARAAASDTAWLALRARCDATTGTVWRPVTAAGRHNPSIDEYRYYPPNSDIGYGYQGFIGGAAAQGYWEASWNLGICYQVVATGAAADAARKAAYAAKAIELYDVLTTPVPATMFVNSGAKAGQTRWVSDMTYQIGTAWTTSVVVNGQATSGASVLSLRGFVPGGTIRAGDGFFINDHIFLVGADTTANSSGVATVSLGGVRSYGSINNRSKVGSAYPDGTAVHTEIVVQSYYHNLAYGVSVTITGAEGLTAANGTFAIATFASEASAPMHLYLTGTAGLGKAAYTNFVYDAGYNQGYGARFIGESIGLLYDWIYPELSQTRKDAGLAAARRWVKMPETTGYAISHPAGNYFAGVWASKLYNAVAFGGEYPEADAWYDEWRANWYIGANPAGCPKTAMCGLQQYFHDYLKDYGHPDGANYGWLALVNTILPIEAHKTAGKGDLTQSPSPPFDWPNGAAQWYVHGTWPNRMTHLGRYKIFGGADPSQVHRDAMFVLGWFLRRNNMSFAPYFQSYLNTINTTLSGALGFGQIQGLRFLTYDPSALATDYKSLPTTFFGGRSELLMRSGWGTSDVMASFVAGRYVDSLDGIKENKDAGSLTIQRGGTGFLVDSNREGGTAFNLAWDYYTSQGDSSPPDLNIFVVNGGGTRYGQGSYGPGQLPGRYYPCVYDNSSVMDRHISQTGWTYARGYRLEQNYYPRAYTGSDPCTNRPGVNYWSREVLYLEPDIWIVHDRTAIPVSTDDQYMGWHFGRRPIAASAPAGMSRYDVSDGGVFKGSVFVVLPASASTAVVDTHNVHAVYRVETRPAAPAAANTWLHVFQASSTSAGSTVPSTLDSASVNGVQLGARVVAFARADPAAPPLTYTFTPGSSVAHYVAGLLPGFTYSVTRDGATASLAADASGVLAFTTSGDSGSVRVDKPGPAIVTPTALPNATTGAGYSVTLSGLGGTAPYTYALSGGSLPAGLTLTAGGILSGAPIAAGSSSFTVAITDSLGASGSGALTLQVDWQPLSIQTAALPDGRAGAAYSVTLSASGGNGSYGWSILAGALPPGITLSGAALAGVPSAGGNFCATLQCASGDGQTSAKELCIKTLGAPATSLSGASIQGVAIR